jgi:type III pantothenate kinase
MRSGVLYGHAAMLDGMIARIGEELGEDDLSVVCTGGLAETVLPYCKTESVYRPDLTLRGLYLIAQKNKR